MYFIGVDIGGTKCAVSMGEVCENQVSIKKKCLIRQTNQYKPLEMIETLIKDILDCKDEVKEEFIGGIGISCGGPLDSKKGMILSPPNLPGWDEIPITSILEKKTGLKAWLCNDANACALSEWKMGAGVGYSNILFLTFGTGLGAGLILDGKLYCGTNDMAGEVGHIRLSHFGPCGYGKRGSFEGFCSGGGIKQLAEMVIIEKLQKGEKPSLCPDRSMLSSVTAETVGKAAKKGNPIALEILQIVGEQLGKGLSILIDVLNPERIIIGSIFERCYEEIWPFAENIIKKEALQSSYHCCKIVPSVLGDKVGDIAGILVAEYYYRLSKLN